MITSRKIELVCPAGNLPSLMAAVENGADSVYLGFRDGTNARNFPGLNFGPDELDRGLRIARDRGVKIFIAINTFPGPDQWPHWCDTVDRAAGLGVDALILADIGLLAYTAERHPQQRLHLSVQASATSHAAINFYARRFGIRRAVLPRVLSLTQVCRIIERVDVGIEVFGYGSLCIMSEGRCSLSSYVTGESPNRNGVCSPARAVRWEEDAGGRSSFLNGVMVNRFAPGEPAGYPTLCKGRYRVDRNLYYALEEPSSLNVLPLLPQLVAAGVAAIKVEGRQRSPAYVGRVTRVLREAIDRCVAAPDGFHLRADWVRQLDDLSEGRCHTLGALHRPWQ